MCARAGSNYTGQHHCQSNKGRNAIASPLCWKYNERDRWEESPLSVAQITWGYLGFVINAFGWFIMSGKMLPYLQGYLAERRKSSQCDISLSRCGFLIGHTRGECCIYAAFLIAVLVLPEQPMQEVEWGWSPLDILQTDRQT